MNTLAQNQKVVKGLSIAAIVISALAIVFSLVMVFTASATLAYVSETIEEYSSLSSYYSSYYYGYVDPDELAAMSFARPPWSRSRSSRSFLVASSSSCRSLSS